MNIFTKIDALQIFLGPKLKTGLTVGFVPTMGALHAGHLNLVNRSKVETDLTVCSIFVNPIQFNNKADLEKYPRPLEQDLGKLEAAGCDVAFVPDAGEMYPEGENYFVDVDFGNLDKVMEGRFRPGHFNGVAIVVKKLFDIVQPTHAYFGKKDYQQLAVIMHMVHQLKLPVMIIPCETVREPDGLAMSSRNIRLTPEQRNLAPGIFRELESIRENAGTGPVSELQVNAINRINDIPGFKVEYLEIGDRETLMPVSNPQAPGRGVAFVAVFAGDVRLIDNIELFS